MQWPLTSQSHGSFSQREQLYFFATDQTPRPGFFNYVDKVGKMTKDAQR
jgi:hypothetical protein